LAVKTEQAAACPCCACDKPHFEPPLPLLAAAPPSPQVAAPAGGGLRIDAPAFLPHAFTEGHQAVLEGFRQYVETYRTSLAPQLERAHALRAALDGVAGEGATAAPRRERCAGLGRRLWRQHLQTAPLSEGGCPWENNGEAGWGMPLSGLSVVELLH
jgi:hypothetical protein